MQIAILIAAMILGLLVLFRLRMVRIASPDHHKGDRRSGYGVSNPFHAVSIEPLPTGCLAAKSIRSQRFLSDEAPALPLATCAAEECKCRYVHYADRRSGMRDRRLGPVEESEESEFWSLRNRRSFSGRRMPERNVV